MVAYYLSIKSLHVLCVMLSGGLFAVRGLLVLGGTAFGNHVALRWLSYAIDTTLLTTALMLIGIIHQYPFTHGWLTAKVVLLVVYIVLGVFALRCAAPRRVGPRPFSTLPRSRYSPSSSASRAATIRLVRWRRGCNDHEIRARLRRSTTRHALND